MRGRKLVIDWQEDEATLYRLYKGESEVELRTRWHALWLLRQGHSAKETAGLVGVNVRTLCDWVRWYREGGIAAVRQHRHGGRQGRKAFLTPEQCEQLKAQTAQGTFTTIGEAVAWVQKQFGVTYTYWGMRSLFQRLKITKKVPRPLAAKASPEVQEAWKKGGLPPP